MSHTAPEFVMQNEIVRAGAGAGKTFTLTHKVMEIADLVFKKEKRWPRVIVTTFTRKATQELRERLMLLALDEKPHLVEFINSRSHLMVSTIHGVMDLFLKRYGSTLGLDPGSAIISNAQATKLARQVLREVILEVDGDATLLETLPFNQLTQLMRRLDVTYGENPEAHPFTVADFGLIYTRRALEVSRELESSAFNIKEETSKETWLKLADDYLALADLLKRKSWADSHESFVTRMSTLGTAPRVSKDHPISEMTKSEAKLAREHAKEFLQPVYNPQAWAHFANHFEVIDRLGRRFSQNFRRAKRELGSLEISDLELLVMECVRLSPESATAFANEWDYWLIDEYQDTSPFQVSLVKELIGSAPVFVVGDPQQSIYLFRGARSEVFAQAESDIVLSGGDRRLLTMNRRSEPELLLFLNAFFGAFDPPFSPMEPYLESREQLVPANVVAEIFIAPSAVEVGSDEASSGTSDGGPKPEAVTDAETDAESGPENREHDVSSDTEMRALVAHVQKLIAQGSKRDEICVLARTNQTLMKVAEWFSRFDLPSHVHAASGFFERREIQDALGFLKFLVNPHDTLNLNEVLRSPCFRMSDQALAEIAQEKPDSLWSGLISPGAELLLSSSEDQAVLQRLLGYLQSVNLLGLTGAFQAGLIESGFVDVSHLHDSSGRREANIWKLLARLEKEEGRAGFNPLSFVEGTVAELKLGDGSGEGDAVAAIEPNRINLMTIHASKGLEFAHVILPRMDQRPRVSVSADFFYDPSIQKWASRVPYGDDARLEKTLGEVVYLESFRQHELAEHARVLYVALTRAKKSVFLSWTEPSQRNSWADMIRLDLSPGVHTNDQFSYVVQRELPERDARVNERGDKFGDKPGDKFGETSVRATGARPKWSVLRESPLPESISVTDILERQTSSVIGASDRDITRRLKVAATGTAVHRLMELLKYPSQERMGLLIARWFPNQADKVFSAIDFVRQTTVPPLLSIIADGEVEWGFSMMERGLLIEGAVDLWGRAPDGTVWIVDYKTGQSIHRFKAFEQMSIYSLALRKSGHLQPNDVIKMAAVYPFAEEIFIELAPSAENIRTRFAVALGT